MKFLIGGLLSLLLLSAPAVWAQQVAPAMREEATAATCQLAAFISLDDARQLPVRRLVHIRLTQEADVRQQYTNDPDMLQKKLEAIGLDYTDQLHSILSPTQYEKLLKAAPGRLPDVVAAMRPPAPTPPPLATPATLVTAPPASGRTAGPKPTTKPTPARKSVSPVFRSVVPRTNTVVRH
ncbi:hypothetical protein [Hymenobacter amundsenii]|nr:hypothetical protein [Hymenobacter amundsenii]